MVKIKDWLMNNKILVLILLTSFAASLAYSFYFKITPAVDARAYDIIAINLAGGHGYREDLGVDIQRDVAIARVGPLYEYFLAGIYKIFGHHYGLVWLFQAFLHALTAWLIYKICLLVFKDDDKKTKIALWAAAIVGFYPDLIEISAMLMTETLYIFLFCLMLFAFFRLFDKKSVLAVILLGLVCGLAVLARPPVLFLVPIIIFYFYRQKMLAHAFLFCIVLGLVFVPWTARNYGIYHRIMPFGAAGSMNFWIGNYYGGDGEQASNQHYLNFLADHGILDTADESIRQFRDFLVEYPGEFIKLTALRINKYFSIIRPMGFWFYQHGWGQFLFLISSALASIILFILGFGGLFRAFKFKNSPLLYLAAFTIITPLIIFITVVETRYRFQIYPLLAIFAGYFVNYLVTVPKWWRVKVLWLLLGIVSLNGLVDVLLSLARLKERIGCFL